MAQCFGKLLRSNFRFGRMFCSRTLRERPGGSSRLPAIWLAELRSCVGKLLVAS
ncbi:MAG: hypothetical protein ACLUNZ_02745 [Evtepia sp.]